MSTSWKLPRGHAPCHLHSRGALAQTAATARSQRSRGKSALRASASSTDHFDAVIIDVDAIVQGPETLITSWAFSAATATAGDIAGSPGLYTRYMQQLLPVLQQPHEAVLMLRLLHEEGIVGARSTAGREGPVVGRPVRLSGSRPLLLNEILEHWAEEILPTCLLRWSRQAGCSSSDLEVRVKEAYQQAQEAVQWEVLDVQQRQHGSSSSSSRGCQSLAPAASTGNASCSTGSSYRGTSSSSSSSIAASTTAVQCLTAPAVVTATAQQDVAASSGSDSSSAFVPEGVVRLTVQPYVSVVPCLQACAAQVFVASSYPAALTSALLSAVQLPLEESSSGRGDSRLQQGQQQQQPVQVLYGSCLQECVQQVQQQLVLQSRPEQPTAATATSSSEASTSYHKQRQRRVLTISSSPCKVAMPPGLQQQQQQQVLQQPGQQQQQQQQQQPGDADSAELPWVWEPVQVAEWACRAPSLRARALSNEGLGLLSEWGLAEVLGVDNSDAVMDGIAWRS